MIDKLSDEQNAKLPEYVDRWMNIGLSTEPVNMEKATEAVKLAYRLAEQKEPTQFFHAKGPLDAIKIIQKLDPSKSKNDIIHEMMFGNHEASWLSFYQFFRDEVGIEECKRLDGFIELAQYCGWCSLYEDVVVFQDRPEIIKFDDENRLHSEAGPAIKFRDGFSVYAWHGVRIPKEWIENKKSLTPKIALTWENVEQRRAACEILGWTHILNTLKAKVVNQDEDPEVGTLVEVNLPDIGKTKFLKVLCGTKREFALPVPPEMKTALEANAWTWGLDADSFIKPEVRT